MALAARRAAVLGALVGLAACAQHPAGSAACVPAALAQLPLDFSDNVPLAQVLIDGHTVPMLIDLGADVSILTEDAAVALKLERTPVDIHLMVGTGGFSRRLAALADHVQLGLLNLDDQRFEVADARLGSRGHVVDGVIGLDILHKYDLDLDLPQARLTLNRAADCDGPPPAGPPPRCGWRCRGRSRTTR